MHCYLCGTVSDLTRDHVPPGGFFPEPRPTDLLTVPCCLKCNNGFSGDDDIMRLYLSANIARSAAGDWIWDNKVVPNTLRRRPATVEALMASMKDVQIQTSAGLVEATSYAVDHACIERFMIRTAKGLLTHHHPEYDYRNAEFEVRMFDSNPERLRALEPVRDLLPYYSRGNGVFQYRGGLTDTKKSGLWIMVFYTAALFLVSHTGNLWGRNA